MRFMSTRAGEEEDLVDARAAAALVTLVRTEAEGREPAEKRPRTGTGDRSAAGGEAWGPAPGGLGGREVGGDGGAPVAMDVPRDGRDDDEYEQL